MTQVDEEELNALREQASQAIPWKAEATRLAEALHHMEPHHKLLRQEIWIEHFQKKAASARGPAFTDRGGAIEP